MEVAFTHTRCYNDNITIDAREDTRSDPMLPRFGEKTRFSLDSSPIVSRLMGNNRVMTRSAMISGRIAPDVDPNIPEETRCVAIYTRSPHGIDSSKTRWA